MTRIAKPEVVTPRDGERAPSVAEDPEEAVRAHVAAALGFPEAREACDVRPTLVYFHWPHDHRAHGRACEALCTRILDEEQVARRGLLFRCVQVDMDASNPDLARLAGATGTPGFAVLDLEARVRHTIEPPKSAVRMREALAEALAAFPAWERRVAQREEQQAGWLDEARELERSDRFVDALTLVNRVVEGRFRTGEAFDRAIEAAERLGPRAASEGRRR
jgi:hypothetical protein